MDPDQMALSEIRWLCQKPSDLVLQCFQERINLGSAVQGLNYIVCRPLEAAFVHANSEDPDKLPHSVAFYLGLHCLPKYHIMGN